MNKNPLDGVDPLGLLERDKNGNLIFYNLEPAEPYEKESKYPVAAWQGYLRTDKGNFIRAYKRIGDNPSTGPERDYTADCHGWSFTNGKYWINNDQVSTILADEYFEVTSGSMEDGDKIIYKENGQIMHSLTVAKVGNKSLIASLINSQALIEAISANNYQAYGKGGNEPKPYLQSIRNGWIPKDGKELTKSIYRKIQK